MSAFLKNATVASVVGVISFGIFRPLTNFSNDYTISERLYIENYKPIQGNKVDVYTQYYEKIKKYKDQIKKDIPELVSSTKADRDLAIILQNWCEKSLRKNVDIQDQFLNSVKYCTMNIKNQLKAEGIRLIKNKDSEKENKGYQISFRKNKAEIMKKALREEKGVGVIKGAAQLKNWCEEALEKPYLTYKPALYKLSKTWCTK